MIVFMARELFSTTEVLSPRCLTDLTLVCSPRAIDSINVRVVKSPLGEEYVVVPNDIGLFIKQQQLVRFNPTTINAVLSEFRASSTELSDSLKDVSDDDIIAAVKSRYIQSPADLRSYIDSIGSAFDSTIRELALERQVRSNQSSDTPSPVSSES